MTEGKFVTELGFENKDAEKFGKTWTEARRPGRAGQEPGLYEEKIEVILSVPEYVRREG